MPIWPYGARSLKSIYNHSSCDLTTTPSWVMTFDPYTHTPIRLSSLYVNKMFWFMTKTNHYSTFYRFINIAFEILKRHFHAYKQPLTSPKQCSLKKHHSEKNINEDFFLVLKQKQPLFPSYFSFVINNSYIIFLSCIIYLCVCLWRRTASWIFKVFKAAVMLHFQILSGNACMAQHVFISGWGFCLGWSYIDPCSFHLWKTAEP